VVFTDQAPEGGAQGDPINVGRAKSTLHVAVERGEDEHTTRLIAVNDCLCVATFQAAIVHAGVAGIQDGAVYRATVQPGGRETLVQMPRAPSGDDGLKFTWSAALGAPGALHDAPQPIGCRSQSAPPTMSRRPIPAGSPTRLPTAFTRWTSRFRTERPSMRRGKAR